MFKFWSVTKVYKSAMIRPIKLFQISALNYSISFCGFGHYNLLFKAKGKWYEVIASLAEIYV